MDQFEEKGEYYDNPDDVVEPPDVFYLTLYCHNFFRRFSRYNLYMSQICGVR